MDGTSTPKPLRELSTEELDDVPAEEFCRRLLDAPIEDLPWIYRGLPTNRMRGDWERIVRVRAVLANVATAEATRDLVKRTDSLRKTTLALVVATVLLAAVAVAAIVWG